jgi:hypothetical protein
MIQLPNQFPRALSTDLHRIYREGLPEHTDAAYVPTMTELAQTISGERYAGEDDYYSLQLANLLREAIRRLPETNERREGIERLFGIKGDHITGLEARRESAAHSLGYKDAETLRRGESSKRPFHDVLLEQLLTQMVALAAEHGFVFDTDPEPTGKDETSEDGSPRALVDGAPASTETTARRADTSSRTSLRRRLRWRWRLATPIGVVVLGAAAVAIMDSPASHLQHRGGWGPTRPVYDYNKYDGNNDCADPSNPASYYGRCGASTDYPVFNSFINTPSYGDERAFFDGYRTEHSRGHASDPVTNVTTGDRVITLRAYVDNMAQVDEKETSLTTAYNTRVRIILPTSTGSNLLAYAYITADRAVTVYDSVDLTSSQPFAIEYVPGSAVLLRHNQSYPLSDEVIGSEGALIGTDAMNGVLPPENDFSGSLVELKVRAVPQTS